jgi:hypothetical protein
MGSRAWSTTEDNLLRELARSGVSLRGIASELGRATSSVRVRAIKLEIAIALDRNSMKSVAGPLPKSG